MYNSNEYLSYRSDCKSPTDYLCSIDSTQNCQVYRNKTCTNSGFNFGVSSRLQYDQSFIHDDIEQSTAPLQSVLDPNRVKNCSQCLSLNGPRASHNGWGDNIPIANPGLTPAQQLVDIDSIMSNRNVKASRDKRGMVNNVDVFKFKTYDAKLCGRGLDPLASILTYPKQLYREMSINRFYDLNINPQVNIYYDWAVNSQLEAKDNYDNPYPYFLDEDAVLPSELGKQNVCKQTCTSNCPAPEVDVRYPAQEYSQYMNKK
jgi:hypothetical protein